MKEKLVPVRYVQSIHVPLNDDLKKVIDMSKQIGKQHADKIELLWKTMVVDFERYDIRQEV